MSALLRPSLFFHATIVVILILGAAVINHGKSGLLIDGIRGREGSGVKLAGGLGNGATCASHDQPNPLAELFPNNATGVLNATLAIIPISLQTARRLIPPQYGILEKAYRALLPDFPEGMYPMLVQAAHDHDVQLRAFGVTLDDFSVRTHSRTNYPANRPRGEAGRHVVTCR
jgi:hypothetical protein